MKKVYLYETSSGYYDDYSTCIEKVFSNKEKAENFCNKKNNQINNLKNRLCELYPDGINCNNAETTMEVDNFNRYYTIMNLHNSIIKEMDLID